MIVDDNTLSQITKTVPEVKQVTDSINVEKQITTLRDLNGIINNFSNPAEMLAFFDEGLRDGKYNLHKWQAKLSVELGESFKTATQHQPYELALRAVNGSGKDKFIISPLIIFSIFCNTETYVVATSSSLNQLTYQTEKYVRAIAEKINAYYELEIFTLREKFITCNVTGSDVLLFRSDEEGKTEGHHPKGVGTPFIIIVNEAKSVEDGIFEALLRCNGYTHWIEVSSPGKPDGHFFRYSTSNRPNIKQVVVTGDDCPHLGENHFKRIAEDVGENTALYRSMKFAEFSSVDEMVVIGYDLYHRCLKFPPMWNEDTKGNTAGLDLSGGGDETVLTIRNGNKVIAQYATRAADLKAKGEWLTGLFEEYNLHNRPIYADAGGLGAEIIKYLRILGWNNIVGIFNQSPATKFDQYRNLASESWFNLKRLIEDQDIILIDTDMLRKQLCNRYYKFTDSNLAQLESKAQAKAKGHPSPDRADSLVLAFYNYHTISAVVKEENRKGLNNGKAGYRINHLEPPSIKMFVNGQVKNADSPYKQKSNSDNKWLISAVNNLNKELAINYGKIHSNN